MRTGTECKEGRESEGNYMETALKVRLSRANDQFIFYSPMVVYSVLDNYYIIYYIIFVLFFK